MDNQTQFPLSDQQKQLIRQQSNTAINSLTISLSQNEDLQQLSQHCQQVFSHHQVLFSNHVTVAGLRYGAVELNQAPTKALDLVSILQNGQTLQFGQLSISLQASEQTKKLTLSAPLMVVDTLSLAKLWAQVTNLQSDEKHASQQVAHQEPLTQYHDFANWQQELSQSEEAPDAQAYWQNLSCLPIHAGFTGHSDLPPTASSTPNKQLPIRLTQTVPTTDMQTLLGGLFALQYLLNDDDSARVDVMLDSRLVYEELADAIGPYSQYLPITVKLNDDSNFASLNGLIDQQLEAHYQWLEFSPLALLDEKQQQNDRLNDTFNDRVNWQFEYINCTNEQNRAAKPKQKQSLNTGNINKQSIHLCAHVVDNQTQLTLTLNHTSLPADFYHHLLERYTKLLSSLTHEKWRLEPIKQLDYQLPSDIHSTNAVTTTPAPIIAINQLIEQSCTINPSADAVVCSHHLTGLQKLSYSQLKAQSDQLAHYLLSLNMPQNAPVVLALNRGISAIVALVSCLKAGFPYVPIDTEQNPKRTQGLLNQLNPAVVLTDNAELFSSFAGSAALQLINLNAQQRFDIPASQAKLSPLPTFSLQTLAYIIFTSGSTGKPKGVSISHENLSHYVGAVSERLGFAPSAHEKKQWQYASVSTLTADLGHTALFGALASGGCIHLIDPQVATHGEAFADYISTQKIDVIKIVPSHLQALRASCENPSRLLPKQVLVLGGESFTPQLANALIDDRANNKSLKLFNHYGPTEATVGCFVHSLDDDAWDNKTIPIGKVLGSNHYRITNAPGCIGELLVAGPSVSPGYYQNPTLTSQSFIEDNAIRYYKTGDKVRLNNHGALEYIGRIDNQIKLRGFRIELGAISQVLLEQSSAIGANIIDARVIVKDQQLIAYIACTQHTLLTRPEEKIAQVLGAHLPSYMLPSDYVFLPKLPLTSNGKLDHKNLPSKQTQAAPLTTKTQQRLAEIWQQLLSITDNKTIGSDSHFFNLGGHSLLATQQVFQIKQQFGITLALGHIFDCPILADLAKVIDNNSDGEDAVTIQPITDIHQASPLSFAQQRLWFLQQLTPNSAFYNVPATLTFTGPLDIKVLEQAFNDLAARHHLLASTFTDNVSLDINGQITQHYQAKPLAINTVKLDHIDPTERRNYINQDIKAKTNQAFDLTTEQPIKLYLYKHKTSQGQTQHQLLVIVHHIICDGFSRDILIEQLVDTYQARLTGEALKEEKNLQYRDYATWQQSLSSDFYQNQIDYWQAYLGDSHPPLNLNTDNPRPIQQSHQGDSHRFTLPLQPLTALAKQHQCTPFVAMLALWHGLLYRYSNQEQIRVGMPISGREHPQLNTMVGLLANTIVTQSKPNAQITFSQLVAQLKQDTRRAFDHQTLPFEQLVQALNVPRSTSHSPLFQAFFSLQPAKATSINLHKLGLDIELSAPSVSSSKFDLSLLINQHSTHLSATIEYDSVLFNPNTINTMAECLTTLFEQVCQNSNRPLVHLPLVHLQKDQSLQAQHSPVKDLLNQFEQHLNNNPNATALTFQNQTISYRALANKVEALRVKIPSHRRVIISLKRSPDVLIAMLATLKQNSCFIPLDPDLPQKRQDSIKQQAKPYAIIDQTGVSIFDRTNAIAAISGYILFTSGSTGKPKGVEVSCNALNHHLDAMVQRHGFHRNNLWLARTTIGFDISLLELFMPLYTGGQLVLAENNNPEHIIDLINQHPIDIVQSTPGAWHQLLDCNWQAPRAMTLLCGGEALSEELAAKLLKQIAPPQKDQQTGQLINVYGPTEATIWATSKVITNPSDVTLGAPLPHYRCYVVNSAMQIQPAGVIGQLAIGGPGLAQGYFNQPKLTDVQFVDDPFAAVSSNNAQSIECQIRCTNNKPKLYLTGDLASLKHSAKAQQQEFIYHGRIDNQIKWRGYRIELGEIVHCAEQLQQVNAAYCLLTDSAQAAQQLICYFTPANHNQAQTQSITERLKQHLSDTLPNYMQPSALVELAQLPLNISGKVDAKALREMPLPKPLNPCNDQNKIATPAQQQIIAIWQQVLLQESIHPDDNFFALGGHSLLLTKLMATLQDELNFNLPLYQLMQADTPAKQAHLWQNTAQNLKRVPARISAGTNPNKPQLLSFAQQRMHFMHQLSDNGHAYNVPIELVSQNDIDVEQLQHQLNQLIKQHSQLASYFIETDQGVRQIVDANANASVIYFDDKLCGQSDTSKQSINKQGINKQAIDNQFAAIKTAHFDLSQAPLLKAAVSGKRLLLVFHHIIVDGWSLNHILADLLANKTNMQQTSGLHDKLQYSDFAAWQHQQLDSGNWQAQKDYWQSYLTGELPQLSLPTDYPRPATQTFNGAKISQPLSAKTQHRLKQLAALHQTSPFQLMLGAYAIILGRFANQNEVIIGTPIANRHLAGSEQIVGLFANTQVYRCRLNPAQNFSDFLSDIKADGIKAQQHQDLPFEQLVSSLELPRDTSTTPLFQAMLVMQNWQNTEHRANQTGEQHPWQLVDNQAINAKFDITLVADDFKELSIEYNQDLFAQSSINSMLATLTTLLEQLAERAPASNQLLSDFHQLPSEQVNTLKQFNQTSVAHPLARTVIDDIWHCAKANPQRTALTYQGENFSYQALLTRSTQLGYLLEHQAPKADVIAILMPRSLSMVVSIIAILRQGSAYLPLGAELPTSRLAYMVNDAKAPVLIAHQSMKNQAQAIIKHCQSEHQHSAQIIFIDDEFTQLNHVSVEQTQRIKRQLPQPQDLAYVMYTSGSTGQPKGVEVPHIALQNRLCWQQSKIGLGAEQCVLHKTPYNFDVSVWELLWSLTQGASMTIAPPKVHQDPQQLLALCGQSKVNVMHFVPSMLQLFLEQLADDSPHSYPQLPALQTIICSGEALSAKLAKLCAERLPHVTLYNFYGPTEAAIDVSFYQCHPKLDANSIPIGKPIDNIQLNVFDAQHNLLPIGAIGELYISGIGLANGYLGQPALTDKKFITINHQRHYQSGDLARWRADGQLEYLGRVDNQVKLRGQRIELSEIEQHLLQHPAITQACVLSLPVDKPQTLNAFVTTTDELSKLDGANHNEQLIGEQLIVDKLLNQLAEKLPSYMLPNSLTLLTEMPVNSNGKADRKALAKMPINSIKKGNLQFKQQPKTDLEIAICQLLAEQLLSSDNSLPNQASSKHADSQQVYLDDDINALGGHSLYLVRLQQTLKQQFKVQVKLAQLFAVRNVSQLVTLIEQQHQNPEHLPMQYLVPMTPMTPMDIKQNDIDDTESLDKPMLVVLHPGSGLTNQYQTLANNIGEQFNVVGINAGDAIESGQYQFDIEQMAENYLALLDKQYGVRSYYLLGWSLGAHIALSMAAKLQAQNRPIPWLGWVDAFVTPRSHQPATFDQKRWGHLLPHSQNGTEQEHQQAQNVVALIEQSKQLIANSDSASYQLNCAVDVFWATETLNTVNPTEFKQANEQLAKLAHRAPTSHVITGHHQQIVEQADFIEQVKKRLIGVSKYKQEA